MTEPSSIEPSATGKRLRDRLVLITGASRGIGRAVAIGFARQGARLILLARNQGALTEVDDEVREAGGEASLIRLDLADRERVDALGPTLYERFGKLDVLIANAAVLGPMSPLTHISSEDWDATLAINLTANWRLIRTLDPLLKRSDAGRAIFISSGAAANPRAFWGPYATTKAGLEALARVYADEVRRAGIKVALLDPGGTRTGMRAIAFPGEDPKSLPPPEHVVERLVELAAAESDFETGTLFQP